MGTKHENETPTILRKLATFLLLFYIIYYLASIILVGSFKVPWDQLGGFPFRISREQFNPGAGGEALGAWLAMVVTYTCSLGLAYWVVRVTRKTWDYLTTTTITHWVLCCLASQAFPINWIWWITILLATLIVSLTAEVLIYRLRDLQDIDLGR